MTPFQWIMKLLDAAGSLPFGRVPRQCPAHADAAPSLSIHERDGRLLIRCHAGCEWRDVLASLRVPGSVLHRAPPIEPDAYAKAFCGHLLFPKLERGNGHPALNGYRLEAVHRYGKGANAHLLERWRHRHTGAKDLMWWTVTESGRMPGLRGTQLHELPLYNEPEIRAAKAMGETIIAVESESSVDALTGWAATTWAGGANSVPVQRLGDVLGGYVPVVYVMDVDDAGIACAQGLKASGIASHLVAGRIGEDAKDLYARLGADAFREMIEKVISE